MTNKVKRIIIIFTLILLAAFVSIYYWYKLSINYDGPIQLNRGKVIEEAKHMALELTDDDFYVLNDILYRNWLLEPNEEMIPIIKVKDEIIGVKMRKEIIYHHEYKNSPWAEAAEYGICRILEDAPITYELYETNKGYGDNINITSINYLEHLKDNVYIYIIFYAKKVF